MKNMIDKRGQEEILKERAVRYEENLNILQRFGNFVRRLGGFQKEEEQSETEKKVMLMQELVWMGQMGKNYPGMSETLESYSQKIETELEVEIHEEGYEQLSRPGFEPANENVVRKRKKVAGSMFRQEDVFRKTSCTRQWEAVLCHQSHKWLVDLHKYLVTSASADEGNEQLAQGLTGWISSNPLHLFLALDQEAAECLLTLADMEEENRLTVNEQNIDSYTEAAGFGLIDINVVIENSQAYLGISMPEKVKDEILPELKKISREALEENNLAVYLSEETLQKKVILRRLYQDFESFYDRIYTLLQTYGFMEKEIFCETFRRVWGVKVSDEELMRFVYLHGTFHKKLVTAELAEGNGVFVSLPWIGINGLMEKRLLYCEDIPYPEQSIQEIEASQQRLAGIWQTICEAYEEWDFEEEELEEIFQEGLCMSTEGRSVSEMMEFLLGWCPVENPGELGWLWRLLVLAGLAAPLYMLKGYSRSGFFEKYGKYQYQDLFTETDKKIRKASLYELPVSLQEQLAHLVQLAEQGKYSETAKEEEQIPPAYLYNEEIKLFLFVNRAAAYANAGIKDRQSKECREVRQLAFSLIEECRDKETEGFILDICGANDILTVSAHDSFPGRWNANAPYRWGEESSVQTIVKGEKIYPNDPCPCGSGKKYKKCCGRKQ